MTVRGPKGLPVLANDPQMPAVRGPAADKIIAHAAAHGPEAARALGPAWQLTAQQIDRFCRQNTTAIARARIALKGGAR